jgi:beta-mannosidase
MIRSPLHGAEPDATAVPRRGADDAEHRFGYLFALHGSAGRTVELDLPGIATIADVSLNGEHLLRSESMFVGHRLDVTSLLADDNELVIEVRSLDEWLKGFRGRPRWRTRVVDRQGLRFARTTILGRAPGFAPAPPVVGPWQEPGLIVREAGEPGGYTVRARLDATGDGVVEVAVDGGDGPGIATVSGPTGTATGTGTVRVPRPERWWPATHGRPTLYDVTVDGRPAGRVGFRTIERDPGDGFGVVVNGEPIFARGASWLPPVDRAHVPAMLARVVAAGMNMLRLPGIGCYEDEAFHARCDELGILVWQDLMLANMDYPAEDARWRALFDAEVDQLAARLAAHASTAVVCGSSEIEQQVAMLGLDPALARTGLLDVDVPARLAAAGVEAPYVPSSPSGGALPFRPGVGVGHYYGVGAYRRPLADARRAAVTFASECLAFSNVPDDAVVEGVLPSAPASVVAHHPAWKAAVPRDNGTGWDFEDVRDHYLRDLYGLDAVTLRSRDHARYLELSRHVTGEVMAATFGEWRRAASPTRGALVFWLDDLMPGAGWGVLDVHGEPKAAWSYLRRALQPVAVWMTDEGTNGLAVHVANERATPLSASLRVRAFHGTAVVADDEQEVRVDGRSGLVTDVEAILGRFIDASYAYRFGPPGHDVVVATLTQAGAVVSEAFHFPAGFPVEPADVGLSARAVAGGVVVSTARLAYGVTVDVPGFEPTDDRFSVAPGDSRFVALVGSTANGPVRGTVRAANDARRVGISASGSIST